MTGTVPDGVGRARSASWWELVRFLPDVARLLVALLGDPRVPWRSKIVAAGAASYVVSPIDVLPDVIPGIGQIDDLYVSVWALRRLARAAGYEVLRERWQGSEDGFALLMIVAGIDR